MASFVMFCRYTDQGARTIKDSPERIEAFKRKVAGLGGAVKATYLLMGSKYDTMVILEAPDDDVALKAAGSLCALGSVRTETHRAYDEEEFRRLARDMGG